MRDDGHNVCHVDQVSASLEPHLKPFARADLAVQVIGEGVGIGTEPDHLRQADDGMLRTGPLNELLHGQLVLHIRRLGEFGVMDGTGAEVHQLRRILKGVLEQVALALKLSLARFKGVGDARGEHGQGPVAGKAGRKRGGHQSMPYDHLYIGSYGRQACAPYPALPELVPAWRRVYLGAIADKLAPIGPS